MQWGWVKTCFHQLSYCHSPEWESNGKNKKRLGISCNEGKARQEEHRKEREIERKMAN